MEEIEISIADSFDLEKVGVPEEGNCAQSQKSGDRVCDMSVGRTCYLLKVGEYGENWV